MSIDLGRVVPIQLMEGQDAEDSKLLLDAYEEAKSFVGQFSWCKGVREAYFGVGIGGVVAVFLFRIVPIENNDDWLWVVTGDLPSAYLVTDDAETPFAALQVYCRLMDEWITAVRNGESLENVYPVGVPPTEKNAEMLAKRMALLRTDILPALNQSSDD